LNERLDDLPNSALKSDGAQARRRLTQRWADRGMGHGYDDLRGKGGSGGNH